MTDSTPLITYTPRYHEIEWEMAEKPDFGGYPGSKAFTITIQQKSENLSYIIRTYRIYVLINGMSEMDMSEFIESWYIVYVSIDSHDDLYIIDNCGNIYEAYITNRGYSPPLYKISIGSKKTPLPDVFIDALLDTFASTPKRYMDGYGRESTRTFPRESMIPLKKPVQPTLPHRSFEPTSDLAAYIHRLETTVRSLERKEELPPYNPTNTFLTSVPNSML